MGCAGISTTVCVTAENKSLKSVNPNEGVIEFDTISLSHIHEASSQTGLDSDAPRHPIVENLAGAFTNSHPANAILL